MEDVASYMKKYPYHRFDENKWKEFQKNKSGTNVEKINECDTIVKRMESR